MCPQAAVGPPSDNTRMSSSHEREGCAEGGAPRDVRIQCASLFINCFHPDCLRDFWYARYAIGSFIESGACQPDSALFRPLRARSTARRASSKESPNRRFIASRMAMVELPSVLFERT